MYVPKKAKLPRKRKKKAIKAQGRKWYHDTVLLHRRTQKSNPLAEPICKFWVNDSVVPFEIENPQTHQIITLIKATKYW